MGSLVRQSIAKVWAGRIMAPGRRMQEEEERRPRISREEKKIKPVVVFPDDPEQNSNPAVKTVINFNFYFPIGIIFFLVFWTTILVVFPPAQLLAPAPADSPANFSLSISYEIARKSR